MKRINREFNKELGSMAGGEILRLGQRVPATGLLYAVWGRCK